MSKTVYLCFSTDIIHGGHIAIIRKAQRLGKLIIGILSDEAVAGYKRFPLVPFAERAALMRSLALVDQVRLLDRHLRHLVHAHFLGTGSKACAAAKGENCSCSDQTIEVDTKHFTHS